MFDSDRKMDHRMLDAQERALNIKRKEVTVGRASLLIRESANQLRVEGVPVKDDARIDMEEFCRKNAMDEAEVYGDLAYIGGMEQEWQQAPMGSKPEHNDDKKLKQGERMEILKTVLFQKYLGRDFIVVRSSKYDDVKNGVDNVIVDRQSGNSVCAFDEVSVNEEGDPVFEEKKNRIMIKNAQGGAKLKYGFSVKDQKITLGAVNNIPIFYLAMSPDKIEAALQSFDDQDPSEKDRAVFRSFLGLIMSQVDEMAKPGANIQPIIKEKAAKIGEALKRYQGQ